MIRITVDLVAYSIDDPAAIAVLDIGNRDRYSDVCDYDFRFGTPDPVSGKLTFGRWQLVTGHQRSEGIWALVEQILRERTSAPDSDYNEPDAQ